MTSRATPPPSDIPSAGAAAESLCRIIEHAPELAEVPSDLIAHHINAIQAIVRERTKLDTVGMASDAEPATARRRRRISHARQSRPPRASRSHPRAEHRAGRIDDRRYPASLRDAQAHATAESSVIARDCFDAQLHIEVRAGARPGMTSSRISAHAAISSCWIGATASSAISSSQNSAGFFPRRLGRKAPQQDQERLGGLTDRSRNASARVRPCGAAIWRRRRACRQNRSHG